DFAPEGSNGGEAVGHRNEDEPRLADGQAERARRVGGDDGFLVGDSHAAEAALGGVANAVAVCVGEDDAADDRLLRADRARRGRECEHPDHRGNEHADPHCRCVDHRTSSGSCSLASIVGARRASDTVVAAETAPRLANSEPRTPMAASGGRPSTTKPRVIATPASAPHTAARGTESESTVRRRSVPARRSENAAPATAPATANPTNDCPAT